MKFNSGVDLPVIRSSERMDYKRCPKRWYWKWRLGLVLRVHKFGAVDLGTWMHIALSNWYGPNRQRNGELAELFVNAADAAITKAVDNGSPDYEIAKAEEMLTLGEAMASAYQLHYGLDSDIQILATEIPLEYTFSHPDTGLIVAAHKIKPDGVLMDARGDVWLFEHKTAKSIETEHLVIDDQARPYGAMAERSLIKARLLKRGQRFRGILYNFLRKALPDERPRNSDGKYLNKDRSVSKRQPPPYFVRKHITMTREAKRITLSRVADEALEITAKTLMLRTKEIHPDRIPKTQHKSCPKTCVFFNMCVAEENGADIRDMMRTMYVRQDPYLYEEESTEDTLSFELV